MMVVVEFSEEMVPPQEKRDSMLLASLPRLDNIVLATDFSGDFNEVAIVFNAGVLVAAQPRRVSDSIPRSIPSYSEFAKAGRIPPTFANSGKGGSGLWSVHVDHR
jgi:hypothetical protein